jgi:hypothetical protein
LIDRERETSTLTDSLTTFRTLLLNWLWLVTEHKRMTCLVHRHANTRAYAIIIRDAESVGVVFARWVWCGVVYQATEEGVCVFVCRAAYQAH